MQHDINHTDMTGDGYADGLASVLLTTFATVLSWQEQAEWAFRKALQFRPNMADVHYNL